MYLVWFYSKKNLFKLIEFEYYRTAFSDLKKSGIEIIYFYKENLSVTIDDELIRWLNELWVSIRQYNNISEILSFLKSLDWKIFINTFEEPEIQIANEIRKWLWQHVSDNPAIFTNKYLQRKIIWEKYPEIVVNFEVFPIEKINEFKETPLLHVPFIMKPTWWVQSSWVHKIEKIDDFKNAVEDISNACEKLKEKSLIDQKILVEEFIDGKMYTIDYFVDEMGNLYLTAPIYVKLWIDYWIQDFCNIVRLTCKWDVVNQKELLNFIKKTVKWWWIKNTFIHHEFKINTNWDFKTIEINWRIWWYRLDMYQKCYNINLLKLPFCDNMPKLELSQNMAVFALYPNHEWIFRSENTELIKKISDLPSLSRIRILTDQKWYKIWFTRNWYSKVGTIVLANDNDEQFKNDVDFIEKNYFNILNVE